MPPWGQLPFLAREVIAAKCPVTDMMSRAITTLLRDYHYFIFFYCLVSWFSIWKIAYSAANSYLDYSAMAHGRTQVPFLFSPMGSLVRIGMASKYTTKVVY